MPIWKRALMTSIQPLSTVNCRSWVRSKSKLNRIQTPTPATSSDATSAMTLCSSSSAFGMTIMTNAPARGRNVAIGRHQSFRKSFISFPCGESGPVIIGTSSWIRS